MGRHYEETLERDMSRIKAKLTEMASLAERAVLDAVRALRECDRQLAYSVILRDERIDELEMEVDRLCLEFIVRQQPVAGHLRFAFSSIKVNAELERVGDYAESIARHTLSVCGMGFEVPIKLYEEMAHLAVPMLRGAAQAFVAQDPEAARAATREEDRVDAMRHYFGEQLKAWREQDQIPLAAFAPLLNIVNRLERVADQARSIAQETVYVSTGQYAKHKGHDVYRVLFVDDADSCRSPMAEAIGNALREPKFVFTSAGMEPAEAVDGATAFFLEQKGLQVKRHQPRNVDQVPNLEHYQVIVALSDGARRAFPPPPNRTVCLEWVLPDPSKVGGRPEEVEAALEQAHHFLQVQIRDLVQAILGHADEERHEGSSG